ncbi:hypothetical protein EYF80_060603 [Liparis tanakae]|uniref:Uncharacterized protein n=1 Tax=Liparis tanakae TaxID=230148 RepID=A0A4Z2EKB3_9TELE|nr:hypothetical protein EYF80_060603 [Liparis tanakae]
MYRQEQQAEQSSTAVDAVRLHDGALVQLVFIGRSRGCQDKDIRLQPVSLQVGFLTPGDPSAQGRAKVTWIISCPTCKDSINRPTRIPVEPTLLKQYAPKPCETAAIRVSVL